MIEDIAEWLMAQCGVSREEALAMVEDARVNWPKPPRNDLKGFLGFLAERRERLDP